MSGNNKKQYGLIGLIYLIVFAVLTLLVMVIFSDKNAQFWVSYIFCVIAFLVQIISTVSSFRTLEVDSVFMGIPLVSLSLYYFFAQVFVAVVFMVFHMAPMKLVVILQLLILAAYAVVAIIALLGRNAAQNVNDNIKEKVTAVRTLNVDVVTLIPQVSDPALRTSLKRLGDTIRYSDPMSTDAVADIEGQIMYKNNELRVNIANGNNAAAMQTCRDMEVLFLQRNSVLKATK